MLGGSITRAQAALDEGHALRALEWLEHVPEESRPPELAATIYYQMAKDALARGDWQDAERHLAFATRKSSLPLYQERLALLRRRKALMDDHQWEALSASVDPAKRLHPSTLSPLVSEVWACGAYYSRGAKSAQSWSQLLRLAKTPSEDTGERQAVIKVAAGFFCRFILEKTGLLSKIDIVTAVPANPLRYSTRMMSLPDQLARAVEEQLAVPFVFSALTYKASADLELRGLSRSERYRAVKDSMGAGALGIGKGRHALVVDDVMTSGATLSEAARVLSASGASAVYGVTMSHTEG